MNIDFNNICNIRETLDEGMSQLQSSYESDWDDPVHDSYHGYIEQVQNCINSITESVETVLGLQEELASIDIDSIGEEFNVLKSEVDAF